MSKLVIGIDPDLIKNGICTFHREDRTILSQSLNIYELYQYLLENKEDIFQVRIEGGWLVDKSNYHGFGNANEIVKLFANKHLSYAIKIAQLKKMLGTRDKISKKVGENHATGKHIETFCKALEIDYKIVSPHRKIWKGKEGKITHAELVLQLQRLKIPLKSRTNQDERDAILICVY